MNSTRNNHIKQKISNNDTFVFFISSSTSGKCVAQLDSIIKFLKLFRVNIMSIHCTNGMNRVQCKKKKWWQYKYEKCSNIWEIRNKTWKCEKKQTKVNFRLPLRISYFVDEIADWNAGKKMKEKRLAKTKMTDEKEKQNY